MTTTVLAPASISAIIRSTSARSRTAWIPARCEPLARESAWIAARRPDHRAVFDLRTVIERHRIGRRINRDDLAPKHQGHVLVHPELRRTDMEPLKLLLARQILLRQWWPFVGRLGL